MRNQASFIKNFMVIIELIKATWFVLKSFGIFRFSPVEGEGEVQKNKKVNNWNQEEQIKKNQKAIEYFKTKLSQKDNRTPAELEQDQEDLRFLQELIKNNR